MSSLMVSNLELMMFELAVQKLFVPKTSIFDSIIMKRTTMRFRVLSCDWTEMNPHRVDNAGYRGTNLEEENFHGGKSVVFAMPSIRLDEKAKGVEVEMKVRKEVSKYFETEQCRVVGGVKVNIDDLFNGIVKELAERRELSEYLSGFHKRQPISRSLKGTYKMVDEMERPTGGIISVYMRLSHLGKSVVTELELSRGKRQVFYAQAESNETDPYECKELEPWQLESGCWGDSGRSKPRPKGHLMCHCDGWSSMIKPDVDMNESDEESQLKSSINDFDCPGGVEQLPSEIQGRRSNQTSTSDGSRRSVGGGSTNVRKKRLSTSESPRVSRKDIKVKDKDKKTTKKGSVDSKVSGDRGDPKVSVERAERSEPRKAPAISAKRLRGSEAVERTNKAKPANDEKTTNINEGQIPARSKAKSADLTSNRRLQLRRQRGVITVGLVDKERKICHEAPPTCQSYQGTSTIRHNVCPNVHSIYCCPTISITDPTHPCYHRSIPIPEITICTN